MNLPLRAYYKGFWGLYTLGAGIGFLPPLIHELLGNSSVTANCLYPPLGEWQQLGLGLTIFFLLAVTLVVFFICRSANRIHLLAPVILSCTFVLGVGSLVYLYVNFVRVVPIESRQVEIPVSVGYDRTPAAREAYRDKSDWEMLDDLGPWEPSVQRLWTTDSIWKVRFWLWTSYTFTLACWLALVSLGVFQHAYESLIEGATRES